MSINAIEEVLRNTIGLEVESIGTRALERAVQARLAACNLEETTYLQFLRDSADELQHLIESVVVNETWFFRDPASFEALVDFIKTSRANKPVRVLSVPCATGEEPYSIAIALLDAGIESSRVKVDAIDVSSRALHLARQGCYGENSFRGGDGLQERRRHFERHGKRCCVTSEVKSLVHFAPGNLLNLKTEDRYDAIFCRNALIYFDAATQRSVLARLEQLLLDDGLLFVGPAETFLAGQNNFAPAGYAMSFALRKRQSLPVAPTVRKAAEPWQRPKLSTAQQSPAPAAPPHTAPSTPAAEPKGLDRARELADRGNLGEARALCEAHISRKGPTAEALHILALVADAAGEDERAERFYRQALYLQPDHHEALAHLALLAERRGDIVAARRYRERVQRVEGRARR